MDGYGTDADFVAYVAAMGVTLPGSANVTAARLRGSMWLDGKYEPRFPGERTGGFTQERAWPRTGAYTTNSELPIPDDVVPLAIEYASYEAAIREARAPGSLSPDYVAGTTVKREKIGPLETEFFIGGTVADILPVLTVIDGLLADYLTALYEGGDAVIYVV